jgi:hypothetical protein
MLISKDAKISIGSPASLETMRRFYVIINLIKKIVIHN